VDLHAVTADLSLELARRPLGDHEPSVDHSDPVREPVGFVQVLRGQEDSRPTGHQCPQRIPQVDPAPDVEAGRRLVEEEHRRPRDERGREVEAAAHASGVGADKPFRGFGEVEVPKELVCPLPGRPRW
jgi:hypothetical protein